MSSILTYDEFASILMRKFDLGVEENQRVSFSSLSIQIQRTNLFFKHYLTMSRQIFIKKPSNQKKTKKRKTNN